MIVDTSALIAIAKAEDGYIALRDSVFGEPGLLPAPAYVEFIRVVARSRLIREREARAFLQELLLGPLDVLSFGLDHAREADRANARFGSGNTRGGTLNLLDLMVYACAKVENRPVLCTGRDFAATDAAIHPASRTS